MNYLNIYNLLIEKGLNRDNDKSLLTYYTETHHIIPRCMGGTDDKTNLVLLTPEEHFTAHLLLFKIYRLPKLALAIRMMCYSSDRTRLNNKMYGWIKTAVSSSISESMKEFWKDDDNKKYMSNARRNAGKPIYQYDLNGNFIRKYRCITDAAEDMSYSCSTSIKQCVDGKRKTAGGFQWKYYYSDNIGKPSRMSNATKQKMSKSKRGITQKRNVPVFQYDTTGKLLRVFPRIKDAAVSVKGCMSNIKKCISGKSKIAYGYVWAYS